MRRLKFIVKIGVLILGLIIGGSFLLPSRWQVERTVVINASGAEIYPFVANLKAGWPQWSAFDYEDPAIKYSFSGPEVGEGAARSWQSKVMGNGTQKITHADPDNGVEFELEMHQNQFLLFGKFTFESIENGATKVTWLDYGNFGFNPFYRYMGLFMDGMMGTTFDRSLVALKMKVEKQKSKQPQNAGK